MKLIIVITLFTAGLFYLVSCGDGNAYRDGYAQGSADTRAAFAAEGQSFRAQLQDTLNSRFITGAFFAVLATLFGATVAERLRTKAAELFNIPPERQAAIAKTLYLAAVPGALGCCLARYGIITTAPVAILLAGSVHPFWFRYLPAIKRADGVSAKSALAKVKTLFFYSLVIMLATELLSESAFIDIRPK